MTVYHYGGYRPFNESATGEQVIPNVRTNALVRASTLKGEQELFWESRQGSGQGPIRKEPMMDERMGWPGKRKDERMYTQDSCAHPYVGKQVVSKSL